MPPLLELVGITKRYPGAVALAVRLHGTGCNLAASRRAGGCRGAVTALMRA